MKHQILNIVKLLGLILGIALSVFLITFAVSADWSQPPGIPPTCPSGEPGCDAPVHVGIGTQAKAGALGVGGVFQSNSATYLAVNTGNVGIGTTSPGAKLDVAGNLSAGRTGVYGAKIHSWTAISGGNGTWSRLAYIQGSGVNGMSVDISLRGTRNNVVWNFAFRVQANHSHNAMITQLSGSQYSSLILRWVGDQNGSGYIEMYDQGADTGTNTPVYVTAFVHTGTLTEITTYQSGETLPDGMGEKRRLQSVNHAIGSSGNLYVADSVGIGTTNPQAKLDVRNNARFYDSVGNLVLIID